MSIIHDMESVWSIHTNHRAVVHSLQPTVSMVYSYKQGATSYAFHMSSMSSIQAMESFSLGNF